jgi:hypothetical protein
MTDPDLCTPRRFLRRFERAAIALLAALSLLTSACADAGGGDASAASEVGTFGRLEFASEPLALPAAGENAFRVTLRDLDSDEPFTGASLAASALMPSMGHTAPEGVHVGEAGAGVYDVEELVFSMPGVWEVRYRATRGDVTDEAAFRYEVR